MESATKAKAFRLYSSLVEEERFLKKLKISFEDQLTRLKVEEAALLKLIEENEDKQKNLEADKEDDNPYKHLFQDMAVNDIPLAGLQFSRPSTTEDLNSSNNHNFISTQRPDEDVEEEEEDDEEEDEGGREGEDKERNNALVDDDMQELCKADNVQSKRSDVHESVSNQGITLDEPADSDADADWENDEEEEEEEEGEI